MLAYLIASAVIGAIAENQAESEYQEQRNAQLERQNRDLKHQARQLQREVSKVEFDKTMQRINLESQIRHTEWERDFEVRRRQRQEDFEARRKRIDKELDEAISSWNSNISSVGGTSIYDNAITVDYVTV